MDALMAYRWPGNIRELKNVVERIVLKAAGRAIKASDLPPEVLTSRAPAPPRRARIRSIRWRPRPVALRNSRR
jgi:DNA-binding NtrC family response regulator